MDLQQHEEVQHAAVSNDIDEHVQHVLHQQQPEDEDEDNKLDLSAPDPTQDQDDLLHHQHHHLDDHLQHTVGDNQDADEHTAFLPSLQFSGSDILRYQDQHPAGGPIRTGDADAAQANFDHWPAEPQQQNEDVSLDNANQFVQQSPHTATPYDRPSGTTYGAYDGAKPKRKRASPQQLTLLNNIFEMTYFPSSDLRLAIGKELDMAPRSVQIWFQNRRSLWRAKASQILDENKARKEELMAQGMTDVDADLKINADRQELAAKQLADQRANDAVEYAINGTAGSLAFALHNSAPQLTVQADDSAITRDDEAGAWSVLQAFHQARTGQLVPQGHQRE